MKHILSERTLDREIMRLSLPSILANLTVPLVGMVDTALAGHLVDAAGGGSAVFIGGISVGAMMLNLLYWNLSFLRTGTGGLTAQAYGRLDYGECAGIFVRGMLLAVTLSLLLIMLRVPLARLGMLLVSASPRVCELALRYFFIRIWAVPATVCLMVCRGWFVGMQDSVSSMWTDLVVNFVNVAASVLLTFGCFGWEGLGFDGIPAGTVVAQFSGLLYAALVIKFKYKRVFSGVRSEDASGLLRPERMLPFMKMNGNLLGRSLCMTAVYMGYTIIASGFGDVLLACSSIMMQLLMLFSYFTDGFAYAGEALAGRFIGARDEVMLRLTVRRVFVWSMGIGMLFTVVYSVAGVPLIQLFTSDEAVVVACGSFLPWLLLMPPVGCAAFTWDGIYLGATASRSLFLSMAFAVIGFFGVWFGWRLLFPTAYEPESAACMHVLLAAYFSHLAARTIYLSAAYRKEILHVIPARR